MYKQFGYKRNLHTVQKYETVQNIFWPKLTEILIRLTSYSSSLFLFLQPARLEFLHPQTEEWRGSRLH